MKYLTIGCTLPNDIFAFSGPFVPLTQEAGLEDSIQLSTAIEPRFPEPLIALSAFLGFDVARLLHVALVIHLPG
eukprot:891135-Amphidinium_carterae.2